MIYLKDLLLFFFWSENLCCQKSFSNWDVWFIDGVSCMWWKREGQKLPGESSDTGVLDGVGLCPGGRKCEGDPLLEPPPVAMQMELEKKN